ncbi:MAG: AAA family ATPase [Oscillospiraceae bacterium]|nr:AAA family ATPase [Oscillospiraceae bacterium]
MIESITMRNCATYDAEGVTIEKCKKVNFIYGPNGSGKSTISIFLQDPSDVKYCDSDIIWQNGIASDIKVYNRKFRELNFKNESIPGIFTIGKATIDDIKKIEELKTEKADREKELIGCRHTLEDQERLEIRNKAEFRDTIWNVILKEHQVEFQDAFSGVRNNKERFRDAVIKKFKECHVSPYSLAQLQERARTIYGSTKPEKCENFRIDLDNLLSNVADIEKDTIWSKVIVGNEDIPIGKLIKRFGNQDWVNRGRQYLKDGAVCPFCQKPTIDSEFRKQLSDFFDGEYQSDILHINELISQYTVKTGEILSALRTNLNNSQGIHVGKIDAMTYKAKIELIEAIINENLSIMNQKKEEPSRKRILREIMTTAEELISITETANILINNHNLLVENYRSEREKLSNDVWTFFLDDQEALITGHLRDLEKCAKAKAALQQKIISYVDKINQLSTEITQAESNVTSIQPTVDAINHSLKAFGFRNFKLVPSKQNKNQYQIQRPDGTFVADTLSEGEETFISFLYFMQLTKGSTDVSKVSEKRIIVLDDPISSLDSTILYIVSAMVKELVKNVKAGKTDVEQVFVMTHNVFFHKEASFIDGRTKDSSDVHFWIIHKEHDISHIRAYGQSNPINTSYELLWRELKDNTSISAITLQNAMRRIIENYFGMLGKGRDDTIINSFDTAEERIICTSLLYWINDGSHTIPDDLYIDSYSGSIEQYREVFRQVFIRTGNEAHYNMMMGIEG